MAVAKVPKKANRVRRLAIVVLVLALLFGGFLLNPGEPHVKIGAEALFHIGDFPVTNSLLTSWIVMFCLVLLGIVVSRRLKDVPSRFQSLVEFVFEFLLDMLSSVAGKGRGRRYFPLIATLFLFILFSNWSGLLPLFGTLGWGESEHGKFAVEAPLFRAPSTDLNFTIGLALISVAVIQAAAIKSLGLGTYLGKFFSIRGPINLVVGVLELIGEFSKIISLAFRLFGNIFAGEVLLAVIGFLVPWLGVLPFLGLELFIGAIQAYIFAILTIVFVVVASTSHSESH